MTMSAPVELKVKVGGVAAAVTAGLLGLLGHVLPGGVVPDWAAVPLLALVTGAVTWGLAWLARHTPRDVVDVTNADAGIPSVIPPPAGPTPQS
jgi:hypothetical protein